jgi:ABC-2 type transport system permease protein
MRNELIVARFEIRSLLGKPSFWLLTVLFPLFIMALTLGSQLMAGDGDETAETTSASSADAPQKIGYVDLAGLIEFLPSEVPPDLLESYTTEEAAMAALNASEINRYYIIPEDFIETGNLTLVQEEFEPFANTDEEMVESILNYSLIGDAQAAALISNPLGEIQFESLAPATVDNAAETVAVQNSALASIVPMGAVMLLFFVLVMSSGYMLRSVSREKENRTVEILLLSLRPRQLMLGKILGLSVVALVQMGLWLAAGLFFLDRGGTFLQTAASLQLPPSFVGWTVAYVLLGYLLYASLMGALGALAPTAREGNQFSFAIMLPLIIPVWLNGFLAAEPNGTIALILSLFPLTSPPAMIARLAATDVPFWQPALGIAGLAITTYLAILLSARFFRADTLLSTAAVNWRRILQAAQRPA